jgi:flagellar basal body-associated protein FliL
MILLLLLLVVVVLVVVVVVFVVVVVVACSIDSFSHFIFKVGHGPRGGEVTQPHSSHQPLVKRQALATNFSASGAHSSVKR